MDPDALLALIAGGGGGVLVLGAGAWAYLRSRGRKRSGDDSTGADGTPTDSANAQTSRSSTALKERPAAPTWDDTLSAPAPTKPTTDAAGTETAAPGPSAPGPVPAAEQTAAGPAAETAPADADLPFDQETAPETGIVEQPRTDAPTPLDQPAAAEQPTGPEQSSVREQPVPAEPDAPGEPTQQDAPSAASAAVIETPEAPADRMVRLRERLSRSGALGRGILTLLTRGSGVDEDTWDEIEETLLLADLGPDATDEMLENLRRRIQVLGTDDAEAVREALREELVALVNPELDRRLAATRREAPDGTEVPSVLLMVGVNGTGKTTTVGKLARVLVAAGRTVVLGAADTFRAAAADQLQTWGARVGVDTVRSDRDGADPAAVAFDAVKEGIEQEVDVVIIDTAGRLQNKKGLMDELGKVRRVAEKGLHGDHVAEVLLVIDATTGQNGMQQARVFSEAVSITGIVLTKLDGTAKGGIVVNVQRELGVPVKMVGLGEGMDDLTPFDPHGFVDALLEG
ncbi:signal recognition particle-docking protein FtsY [Brachybacterium avium]|uniref:Signal recognition particle receptor FtsY n=1 Tax=Brachybacterium avium TaxID=2017485 RepID=A0A220UEB2_9MICO|nr:signal recognition particle-docking protein FtsY [Brachybacterium avium]ASK66564.1 signal recognition particle-docking protein FtsY [Brachybacterium avium]